MRALTRHFSSVITRRQRTRGAYEPIRFSSAHFTRVALNGNAVTEGEFNAAFAGALGVPVIFASGDDAAVEELKTRLGSIETAETKKSLSFHSAETLSPEASCERIAAGVKWALERLHNFQPNTVRTPVSLQNSFQNYTPAQRVR